MAVCSISIMTLCGSSLAKEQPLVYLEALKLTIVNVSEMTAWRGCVGKSENPSAWHTTKMFGYYFR